MVLGAIAPAADASPFGSCRAIRVKLKPGFGGQRELRFRNRKGIRFVQTDRGTSEVIANMRHKRAATGCGRAAINRVTATGAIGGKAEEMKQMANVSAMNFEVRCSRFIGAPPGLKPGIRGNGGIHILGEMGNDHEPRISQGGRRETCGVRKSTDVRLNEVIPEEPVGVGRELP